MCPGLPRDLWAPGKNEVSLITISLVASILNESNHKILLSEIRGKSQREVETIVAAHRPPVSMRDRARPVFVATAKPTEPSMDTALNSGRLCPITPSGGSEISPNVADGVAADSVGGPPRASTEKRTLLTPGESAPDARRDQSAVGDALGRSSATSGPTVPSPKPTPHLER